MALSVPAAIRDGLGRTFERNGLQLVAAFFLLRLATAVVDDTSLRANIDVVREAGGLPPGPLAELFGPVAESPTPLALDVGLPVALLLVVIVVLLAEAVRIVAVRTLVSDRVDAVPAEYRRRNLAMATLNGFVGGLVVLTLSALGLVFLVLPGVFLAVSFFFVRQEIAVRDVNFVEAMSGSWSLAAGHRLQLLGLAAAVLIVELVATFPGALVFDADPVAAAFVGAAAQAPAVVFGIASTCRAYDQLRTSAADDEAEEDADPYSGALGPDDLPEPGAEDG